MIVKVGEKDHSSPFFRFLLRFCRCRRCFVICFRGPCRRLHSQQPECSGAFVEIYQVFGVSTCVTACRRIRDVAADGLRSLVIDYRNFGRSDDRVRGRYRTSCRPGGRDYNIHGIRALLRCDRMAHISGIMKSSVGDFFMPVPQGYQSIAIERIVVLFVYIQKYAGNCKPLSRKRCCGMRCPS